MINRVIIFVLDSFGVGEAPDANVYGDEGSNTLVNIYNQTDLKINNMRKMGLYNIDGVNIPKKESYIIGSYGKAQEKSKGKNSPVGHWEISGYIKENMPMVFYTNILYYNNFNETLPVGMDVTDKVIINGSKFNFVPKNMLTFNITKDFEENEVIDKPNVKNIILCEYDLELMNEEQIDNNQVVGKEKKDDK